MQYTSSFNFSDINQSKLHDGLVPVIVQDIETYAVRMLGYMNEDAFNQTCKTGYVTFYSRSSQRLWQKGEDSGHVLNLVSMHLDCDSDTILALVHPIGNTCHLETKTCWGKKFEDFGFVGRLHALITEKHMAGYDADSYTSCLLSSPMQNICDKVTEECKETVTEATKMRRNAFLYEVCDLIYHLLILLVRMGVSKEEINDELYKRHLKK